MKRFLPVISLICLCTSFAFPETLSEKQKELLKGARSTLGDRYDSGYYAGGPPPKGRGACTDVLYYALLKAGLNLQNAVDDDKRKYSSLYSGIRDRNIDYRRCPNLVVWFKGYTKTLTTKVNKSSLSKWKPGDIVIWTFSKNGVTADHCGIISDKESSKGIPLVIHNFPPMSKEEDVLMSWRIVGHFRY
ncbi:MAG: DUF1287 domain-containing protein [Candidatus Xenobiia bacterium LiM19]